MPFFHASQKMILDGPVDGEYGTPAQRALMSWPKEVNLRENGTSWEILESGGWMTLANQDYYIPEFRVRAFILTGHDVSTAPDSEYVLNYDLPWPNPELAAEADNIHTHGYYGWFSSCTEHSAWITRVRLSDSDVAFSLTNAPMIKLLG